jgi:hypothetical protein
VTGAIRAVISRRPPAASSDPGTSCVRRGPPSSNPQPIEPILTSDILYVISLLEAVLGQTAIVRCDECRYDYDSEDEATIPDRVRTLGGRYRAPLTRFLPGEDGPTVLRAHPIENGWSALEYACHVRDVLDVIRERLAQGLAEDVPTYVPMGRDQRVIDDRYNEQDPAEVVATIGTNAGVLADAFADLSPAEWTRTGIYNFPEPTERSMVWLGQHVIHEAHHHLLDVGRTLRAARGR